MYRHGIYNSTTDTEMTTAVTTTFAQVAIGTAPVHMTADPTAAVNKPVICYNMAECRSKLGYSADFAKYTLCQAMYASFSAFSVAPVVFINVLDPSKHFTAVEETDYPVSDNAITIEDDVIVSTLVIEKESTPITADKYETEWVNGKLVVNFAETQTGEVSVSYNKADVSKVTAKDIIGAWDTETDARTGMEVIKSIYPMLGVVPLILTAPGWTTDDTVGAALAAKAAEINGCYKGMAICDIDSTTAKTRAAAIEEKQSRTLNENCIAVWPMIKKNDMIIALSAYLAALIMSQAAESDGVTCKSPSNQRINIDDVVLNEGTSVYYDQEDGNELNAEGIVTVISRNGWYVWGNNTAAYPDETDPVKRWIMTRLSFLWIENDFINSNFTVIDSPLSSKMVEDCITDENIKLAAYTAAGYIAGGTMYYNSEDNPSEDILDGKFTFRTELAANVPGECIENVFSFDTETLRNSILGGTTNE